MHKKILTVEQLAAFCFENKMYNFDAGETGYKLCVQTPSVFTFNADDSDSILYGNIKLLHTNTNRNHSNVTKDAAEKCMSGIKYKPVLANFCTIDDVEDFTSHDMEINDDGSINYLEHQIGCFTADEPYMEYEEDTDRYYIYAKIAIPREYSHAASIIERKNGTKCSAELFVNKMSYDAENKELLLEDIEVMGVTLLGTDPKTGEEVQEGMQGARVDIADFSVNNSVKFEQNDKLIETLEKLNTTLSGLNINYSTKEGGNEKEMDKFTELLTKYEKTVEDITFEYEGLSDEELEAEFAKAFEDTKKIDDTPAVTPDVDDSDDDSNLATNSDVDSDDDTDTDTDSDSDTDTDADAENFKCGGDDDEKKKRCSIEFEDNKREFSISLSDKQRALETLVNDTYCEIDNDYYFCDVFEEDGCVVMHSWSGNHFRQNFKCKKNVYSLVGDRVPVFAQYLTQDEITKLENMKANYSSIEEKLSKYEAEPEKIQILESSDYASISDKAEFVELMKQENHFDLSVEDLKAKADEIILSYAKAGQLNFAADNNSVSIGKKIFAHTTKKTNTKRYGGLVKKNED